MIDSYMRTYINSFIKWLIKGVRAILCDFDLSKADCVWVHECKSEILSERSSVWTYDSMNEAVRGWASESEREGESMVD